MYSTRRDVLRYAAAVSAGFASLRFAMGGGAAFGQGVGGGAGAVGGDGAIGGHGVAGYGPLVSDPAGVIDLPEGFSYRVISRRGELMHDGLLVPAAHDGMGAFAGPNGLTVLVRNHELADDRATRGAFGAGHTLLGDVHRELSYDAGFGMTPSLGGTTTILYDTKRGKVVRHFASLLGTGRNCAGGETPWGSWLTCEEWTQGADERREKDHGYVFEVPSSARGLVKAEPIKGMGRFNHEAVAVDPVSGVVYLTEDRGDSLLYRYVPNVPGEMLRGGRLEALALLDRDGADTRNYVDRDGKPMFGSLIEAGEALDVRWVPLDDVEQGRDDLRFRGFAGGAARFARGEGMWYGRDSVFFACTSGGPRQVGQVWRYVPSRFEGRADEEGFPGRLQLYIEPNDSALLENADNLTVAPWGDLFVCEDGDGDDRLVRVDGEGGLSTFALCRMGDSEFAGACFSPDGSTLFVNIQAAGMTVAISGDWGRGRGA